MGFRRHSSTIFLSFPQNCIPLQIWLRYGISKISFRDSAWGRVECTTFDQVLFSPSVGAHDVVNNIRCKHEHFCPLTKWPKKHHLTQARFVKNQSPLWFRALQMLHLRCSALLQAIRSPRACTPSESLTGSFKEVRCSKTRRYCSGTPYVILPPSGLISSLEFVLIQFFGHLCM